MVLNSQLIDCIIGKHVSSFVLRVFPPFAESVLSSADVSFLLRLDDGKWYLFHVRSDDNWSVEICCAEEPDCRGWDEFNARIPLILSGEIESDYDYEFYNGTDASIFSGIAHSRVLSVDVLSSEGSKDAFGIRLNFEDDFILLYPNTDGSAIETKEFKQGRGLREFEVLGKIEISTNVG
ncbi:hypothetical protein FNU76_04475 [Chitinimonas arctica]|uniref:Uncharacterized protein n=1 Tax=Chitinimonas arctica TaxID=2594795 RepID=A0A516SBY3_9NEIS|nr:hypothetical protein [Chitinimonas arctica]QDQ25665.1 hypothetical protein FNU76_04475 [Chitinimonas arctica]